MTLSPRVRIAIVALIAAILGVGTGALVLDGDDRDVTQTTTTPAVVPAAVAVDSTGDGEPDKALELDRPARALVERAADAPEELDLGGGLRGADPTPVAQLDAPLASPSWPGCSTRILPTNWSNRTASVRAIGLHYTASGNLPGLSDMNGLTAYASSSRAGVSWHFLIDAEGHCYYSVPVGKKAWTIGNLNSQTVNIEVIGRGNENAYPASSAGARKLASVVQRIGRLFNVPMRLGAVSNCRVTRSGIITHWMGGSCSGGHHDIKPYDIAAVVRRIAAGGCDAKCQLDRERRARHRSAHAEIKRRNCAPIERTRSARCLFLHRRLAALHAVGVKY